MALTYEVIQSMNAPPLYLLPPGRGPTSAAQAAFQGTAQLLSPAIAFFQDSNIKWEIDIELARMALDLKKAKGNKKGVLAVVEIQEWNSPHDAGRARRLHSILIGPAGNDMNEALRWWMMHDQMFAGAPKGWRLSAMYLWVTAL